MLESHGSLFLIINSNLELQDVNISRSVLHCILLQVVGWLWFLIVVLCQKYRKRGSEVSSEISFLEQNEANLLPEKLEYFLIFLSG